MARLHEHLDGELPPSDEAWIRVHLGICGDCRSRANHERAFLRALHACQKHEPASASLRARIERSLRGGGRRYLRDD
jgi:anti-sigma factor RsiW